MITWALLAGGLLGFAAIVSSRPRILAASHEWTALAAIVRQVAPPPELRVSEWAEVHRIVARGDSATPGPWQNAREPWQIAIMDSVHEGAENIVVMKAGQVGVTECLLNIWGYKIAHDPASMLWIEPSESLARRLSRRRVAAMIRSTLVAQIDPRQPLLQKTYGGGTTVFAGSNSPTALSSDPMEYVFFDERNKYKAALGPEGDPVWLGMKRTETYWNRRHFHVSTPTSSEAGGIEAWYAQSDQRRFYVPCPRCGAHWPLAWAHVEWDGEDASSARWRCPACREAIADHERHDMIARGAAGEGGWRSTAPFNFPCPVCVAPVRVHRGEQGRDDDPVFCAACERRIEATEIPPLAPVAPETMIGFHVPAFLKSTVRLSGAVAAFLRARRLGVEAQRAWQNGTLGEPYQEAPPVEPTALLARVEVYPSAADTDEARLPAGVLLLVAGVDTQDDRLEYRLWGYGIGEERWLIDIRTLPGDPDRPEVWAMLDALREERHIHPSGQPLGVEATAIDSAGHKTDAVYEYVRRHQHERVYATIGRDGQRAIFTPGLQPSSKGRRAEKRRVPLYIVGVDSAKSNWLASLRVEQPGPGYAHLPQHPAIESEVRQLTSERLVRERGVWRWRKVRAAERNEGLDCAVLSLWALRALAGGGTTEAILRYAASRVMPTQTAPEPDYEGETIPEGAEVVA